MDKYSFTKRELEIIKLLLEGKSNKQIALALNISESTVEYHLKNIYAKLGVDSRVEAILRLQGILGLMDETGVEAIQKLRESPGISGDSVVEVPAKKTTMDIKQNETDLLSKEDSKVARRVSLVEIIRFLLTYKIPIFIWMLIVLVIVWLFLPPNTAWIYEREGEYPDEFTVGMVLQRTDASGEMAHGQFGTVPAWPAQPGYVKYENIEIPQTKHLFLKFRYSKHSASEVLILIYLDDESLPRAEVLPINQGSWEKFVWTNAIDLGRVERGIHSVKFYTDGQVYGVADLDKFILTTEPP